MNRRGYTLIELALVLAVIGVAAGVVVGPAGHVRDVLAVRSARAELSGLTAIARSTAILTGGAALVVDIPDGSASIQTLSGERVGDVRDIAARHGVSLEASSSLVRIRYDALGIGRMANAVIRIRAGNVTGTITVSTYGRVRQS